MFINLKIRSEGSFRKCYGPIDKIIEAVGDAPALALTDNNSTWMHAKFHKKCKKAGKKPILGVIVNVVDDLSKEKETRGQRVWQFTLLARNLSGLQEIYRLNSRSWEQMYYFPRTHIDEINTLSTNVIVIAGMDPPPCRFDYIELNPGYHNWNKHAIDFYTRCPKVFTSDVFFPRPSDRVAYEMIDDDPERKTTPQHILIEEEAREYCLVAQAIDNTKTIADMCEEYTLPQAGLVHFEDVPTLEEMCRANIPRRGVKWNEQYEARLRREIDLIGLKRFEDYFYLVADMVVWAKERMLVGPARGSAAGSLVCYLLYITEVDPIPHNLIFERFIDITRADLPDIDLDFPDDKREEVIHYLEDKYGKECVAHIGTVTTYKPKSAIGDVAKKYQIPAWETKDVKDAIIERSGGDARAAMCITDTFETLDVGKAFIGKYPEMKEVGRIEGHAKNSGCHSAGIIVCSHSIKDCCTVNDRDNVAQIDKYDAEALNLLKIDILGLRTLTVLNSCMEYLGRNPRELYDLPLDDSKAFTIINERRYSGIFQFEGYALQSLVKQMGIHKFDDIVAITALARPGPLHCGGATAFVQRRTGQEEAQYDHPLCEDATKETFGITVYQEQLMQLARDIGKMTWEEVSYLRKAVSKSLGDEFFNSFWGSFLKGALENGLTEQEADKIWKGMVTHGSWSFNKSHAVSYGLLSYWCAYLKAHHPLEYALACLNNEKDPESTVKMLRELVKEGYKFKPFDYEKSQIHWSISDGMLIGGLTSIKGVGVSKAEAIVNRRRLGLKLLPGQIKLLTEPETPWDNIFETEKRFGDMYANPEKYNITSQAPKRIMEIDGDGEWIIIGRLKEKNLRDLNEYNSVARRGGTIIKENNLFLNMIIEDDTDSIMCSIDRYKYEKLGKPIIETGKVGESFYLIKGNTSGGWRRINVRQIKALQ